MGKNLVADKHPPEGMKPGQPRREDYTYEKKGAGNVFIGCRAVGRPTVSQGEPTAHEERLDTFYPATPEQAKALADKLEIHYTPKHASWLNIAEIELSALVRQGLAHNIATMQEFCEQAEQWQDRRNQAETTVSWHFTTADARITLKRLYPVLHEAKQSKRGSMSNSA